MTELLSVIIPVYQAKEYLYDCVMSVTNQKYHNLEIILIDDGSTDGSSELCDSLVQKDSRIKVEHMSNSGPFAARKKGVEISNGNIVTFVDADDWIEPNAYFELLELYRQYAPDIICFSYQTSENHTNSENYFKEGFYDKTGIEREIISSMIFDIGVGKRKINPSVCCKIFKKNLFQNVTLNINTRIVWGDDAIVTYPVICKADNLYITHKVYYHYRENLSSSTHKFPSERIDELENFYTEIKKILSPYDKKFDLDFQINHYLMHFLDLFIENRFGIHTVEIKYIFPYAKIPMNSKIQLYGAGEVGRSFALEILQSGYAELVGWYDKKANLISDYAGVCIDLPKKMLEIESDFVLIAIIDRKIAKQIELELMEMGVSKNKICWSSPLRRF